MKLRNFPKSYLKEHLVSTFGKMVMLILCMYVFFSNSGSCLCFLWNFVYYFLYTFVMKTNQSTFESFHWHISIIFKHFSFDSFLITGKNVLRINICFPVHAIFDKMSQIRFHLFRSFIFKVYVKTIRLPYLFLQHSPDCYWIVEYTFVKIFLPMHLPDPNFHYLSFGLLRHLLVLISAI